MIRGTIEFGCVSPGEFVFPLRTMCRGRNTNAPLHVFRTATRDQRLDNRGRESESGNPECGGKTDPWEFTSRLPGDSSRRHRTSGHMKVG